MGKTLLVSVIVNLLLVSCARQGAIPTPSLSVPAEPTLAATSAPALISPTNEPPTPTLTPFPPYPNKKVIFEYYEAGQLSEFLPFFKQGFRDLPELVLYEDGLMILVRQSYMQKVLSPNEVKRFFSKLEELGFYSLESNQKHDPTDKLYNYGDNYQQSADGPQECIYAKTNQERTLCAYQPDMQYLVPGMKRLLAYLDGYKPTGLTPYFPDRILLWVQEWRNSYSDPLPGTATPWGDGLPVLATLPSGNFSPDRGVPREEMSYFDGPTAKAIYLLVGGFPYANRIVAQDGQEYLVSITVVLPHEELTNAYQ
jgi:hypothetical protein